MFLHTTEGYHTVLALVKLAAEGDEGAEEQLFNRGTAGRDELLKLAADRKSRKQHPTVAWLLLTLFPSPESEAAAKSMLDNATEPDLQNALAVAIAAGSRRA